MNDNQIQKNCVEIEGLLKDVQRYISPSGFEIVRAYLYCNRVANSNGTQRVKADRVPITIRKANGRVFNENQHVKVVGALRSSSVQRNGECQFRLEVLVHEISEASVQSST